MAKVRTWDPATKSWMMVEQGGEKAGVDTSKFQDTSPLVAAAERARKAREEAAKKASPPPPPKPKKGASLQAAALESA